LHFSLLEECISEFVSRDPIASIFRDLSGKTDVLIQPKDNTQTKPKSRLPAKQEVKTDSFQGIQLKPITKEGKKPQQAENGRIELKVAPLMGMIVTILLLNLSFSLFLCAFELIL
jgi:hypothetical protein